MEEPHATGGSGYKEFLPEFVYGGIDGAITTFAVVAGATGASLDIPVVIILGFANLIADGFSMSVGNFFSTKAGVDAYEKHVATEHWEIDNLRETEVEEIRDIYRKKGFKGELLEQVVAVITSDKEVWVDTMMKEELEMAKDSKSPYQTAGMTFFSFLLIGFIPLAAYVFALIFDTSKENLFIYACILTGVALSIIGVLKSTVNKKNIFQGIAETLFLGGIAAILAYFAGDFLENLFR
ncbi:VIT1/CCC1 transporter family protein [Pontibacter anaerobius]|uniref:VIT1/CCC1 transporter family protein n=1 Tax=Pontibacter anaerobius TaxID=2993940 RepID=A0ABT3RBP4_9BACT|nr:VIT1/CCC1 transporter family protein [Pontibacter anaerobius]MCX2738864.1 VIT1/CCC1 transporter family protein [Pontibacter anaerobius]